MFKNCNILIIQAGLSKKRMSIFEKQITNSGGVCLTKLGSDLSLTHVVVEDSLLDDPEKFIIVLHNAGFTVPVRVPVVGTQWLSNCLKEKRLVETESYSIRVPCTVEQSEIHPQLTQEADVQDTSQPSSAKRTKGNSVEKYTCSHASIKTGAPEHNVLITKELQKLADAYCNSRDQWRAYGYEKAISAIKSYGKEITSSKEVESLPGIGKKMAAKVAELLETGKLQKVEEVCLSEKTHVLGLFTRVWGVGPATAEGWYLQGLRTLDDLRNKASLTRQQQIGLRHFEDLQARIPREEVKQIGEMVQEALSRLHHGLKVELCGSYRRGKEFCGDVDILISVQDMNQSGELLTALVAQLRDSGFITDDLVSMEVNGNQKKYLGVCCLPGENQKHRRLDIFVVPKTEYATALMHYTGSALFNRSIRLLAKSKGMSLSEHSLVAGIVRQDNKTLNDGYFVPTPTEESIFEHLGLEFRPPEERDH